jgi:hypothetical protein
VLLQVASDVIAVFKQAAGANADQILKRIADYGVSGRKTALDADMFTRPGAAPSRPCPSRRHHHSVPQFPGLLLGTPICLCTSLRAAITPSGLNVFHTKPIQLPQPDHTFVQTKLCFRCSHRCRYLFAAQASGHSC